ncbi:methyl-accepting chemotaxis protein [Niveibacterium terrae]|uniref:methyl-accepting chemotaxis protein n=1 Tax=Niveibacterium terrae TaxID=3373598 RepID=UPI003A8F9631
MDLTIAKRLWILMIVAVLSLLLVGASGMYVAGKLSDVLKETHENILPSEVTLLQVAGGLQRLRVRILQHNLLKDEARRVEMAQRMKRSVELIESKFKDYEKLVSNDEDRRMLEDDRKAFADYLGFVDDYLKQSATQDAAATTELIVGRGSTLGNVLSERLDKHVEFIDKFADQRRDESEQARSRGEMLSWLTVLTGAALVSGLGFFLIRGINRSIRAVQSAVGAIESRLDFTLRAPVFGRDEIALLSGDLNRLLGKLQQSLKAIHEAAKKLAGAANEVATTSDQVATAAAQQSESASNMAASVEQMTVSINHVGDRALEANRLSLSSGEMANAGEATIVQTAEGIDLIAVRVSEASDQIRKLEEQSEQISSVVQVISEVAEQTNLLALNAAIEAARAGEQGRGFAVVADEVRKLAERTASSTQQITQTIAAMRDCAHDAVGSMAGAVSAVTTGVERAQEASESIRRIGGSSREAVAMVGEISNAIREQSAASTNIAQSVERVAQMADESSAAAMGSADSARELDQIARGLEETVARYTV